MAVRIRGWVFLLVVVRSTEAVGRLVALELEIFRVHGRRRPPQRHALIYLCAEATTHMPSLLVVIRSTKGVGRLVALKLEILRVHGRRRLLQSHALIYLGVEATTLMPSDRTRMLTRERRIIVPQVVGGG